MWNACVRMWQPSFMYAMGVIQCHPLRTLLLCLPLVPYAREDLRNFIFMTLFAVPGIDVMSLHHDVASFVCFSLPFFSVIIFHLKSRSDIPKSKNVFRFFLITFHLIVSLCS